MENLSSIPLFVGERNTPKCPQISVTQFCHAATGLKNEWYKLLDQAKKKVGRLYLLKSSCFLAV